MSSCSICMSVCVCVSAGMFDIELPAVVTIADGETSGTVDIAISNDASLTIGSEFIITLTNVHLHTGHYTDSRYLMSVTEACSLRQSNTVVLKLWRKNSTR